LPTVVCLRSKPLTAILGQVRARGLATEIDAETKFGAYEKKGDLNLHSGRLRLF